MAVLLEDWCRELWTERFSATVADRRLLSADLPELQREANDSPLDLVIRFTENLDELQAAVTYAEKIAVLRGWRTLQDPVVQMLEEVAESARSAEENDERFELRYRQFSIVNAVAVSVPLSVANQVLYYLQPRAGKIDEIDLAPPTGPEVKLLSSQTLDNVGRIVGKPSSSCHRLPPLSAVRGLSASGLADRYRGRGVTVALIDSGVDPTHLDVGDQLALKDGGLSYALPSHTPIGEIRTGERYVQQIEIPGDAKRVEVSLDHPMRYRLAPYDEVLQQRQGGIGLKVYYGGEIREGAPGTSLADPMLKTGFDYNATHGRYAWVEVDCGDSGSSLGGSWDRAFYQLDAYSDLHNGSRRRCGFVGSDDDWGHGTAMAGILAGTGAESGGRYRGIAPEARLVPIKTLKNANDWTGLGGIVDALDWLITRNDIRLANLSLGEGKCGTGTCIVCAAVSRAVRSFNKIIVTSSGNEGTGGVTCPATSPDAIVVGAASAGATPAMLQESGHGTQGPHLVVRGEDLVAPAARFAISHMGFDAAQGSFNVTPRGRLRGGDGYTTVTGTSAAAAVVSGVVALLLEHNPNFTRDRVLDLLRSACTKIDDPATGSHYPGQGEGMLDAMALYSALERVTISDVVSSGAFSPGATTTVTVTVESSHDSPPTTVSSSSVRVRGVIKCSEHTLVAEGAAEVPTVVAGANHCAVDIDVPASCPPGDYILSLSLERRATHHDQVPPSKIRVDLYRQLPAAVHEELIAIA